jgi:hypothetical protein
VDVRVDKAGKESGAAQVNDFGAGGAGDFRADFGYGVANDQDFAGSNDAAGLDVEQARGVEDDCVRAWPRLGLCRLRSEWCAGDERQNEG